MAWRDRYHYQGNLWLHQPEIMYQQEIGVVDEYTSSDIVYRLTLSGVGVLQGAITNVKPNMTVLIGSTAGASDLGRTRVISVTDDTLDYIYLFAPRNNHDGEINPTAGDFVTVLDEYRVWMRPPFATGGSYWYDGTFGPQGCTYEQVPIANGGAAYAGEIDQTDWIIEVDFDASDSFAVADDAVLGGYTADLFGGSETLTASSGTPANAIDGNTATYWQPTTDNHEYMHVDFGVGVTKTIRKSTLTCSTNYGPTQWSLQWSDDNTNWVTAFYEFETAWGTNEQRTYTNHHAGAHRYWRLYVYASTATYALRIEEWELFAEDRTAGTSPYTWDVKDGIITSGSTTTESITVEFPSGFRYVELTVTDTNAEDGVTNIPVLGVIPQGVYFDDSVQHPIAGASYLGFDTDPSYPASNAFDGIITRWVSNTAAGTWVRIQFPSKKWVGRYTVKNYVVSMAPTQMALQGSNDGTTWTTIDLQSSVSWSGTYQTQSFDVDNPPGAFFYYRLYVIVNGGSGTTAIVDIILYPPDEVSLTEGHIQKFTVNSHTMEQPGQVYEFGIFETLPTDSIDGGMVLYWENEYYDNVAGSLSAAGATGREHMRLHGWIDTEQNDFEGTERVIDERLVLRCLDTGQRLQQLIDFTFMAQRDAAPAVGYEMKHANMDVYFYLMIRWLSTAAEMSDFIWSHTCDHYNFGLLAAQGANIYDMMNQKARAIDHIFTCNKMGQIKIVPDLLRCASEFRASAATAETLTAADYTLLSHTYTRTARYHWAYGSGVGFYPYDADSGSFAVDARFTIAPGQTPGQGVTADTEHERLLALSDSYDSAAVSPVTSLYERTGRSYAQKAAYNSIYTITLVHAGDTGLDPAEDEWLNLTIPSTLATYRGRTLTAAPGVILRISEQHDHNAMTKTVTIEWEEYKSDYVEAWAYFPS